jgi:hypothetical protein
MCSVLRRGLGHLATLLCHNLLCINMLYIYYRGTWNRLKTACYSNMTQNYDKDKQFEYMAYDVVRHNKNKSLNPEFMTGCVILVFLHKYHKWPTALRMNSLCSVHKKYTLCDKIWGTGSLISQRMCIIWNHKLFIFYAKHKEWRTWPQYYSR